MNTVTITLLILITCQLSFPNKIFWREYTNIKYCSNVKTPTKRPFWHIRNFQTYIYHFIIVGGKFVFQPTNYNFAKCRADRYQPIAFVTNGNTDCIFQKSSCSEEGQVVCKNLSPEEDAACRCDYTKGYTFVSNTMNPCYCIPSKEDCSCFKLNNISEVGK